MPTADAALHTSPYFSSSDGERTSTRCLEDIGVEAVLGAMIEQKRRATQPSQEADADDTSEVFVKAR